MGFYETYILPHVINCACGTAPIGKQREKIVPRAEGRVLEIGIGSGLNLPFYDSGRVSKVIGLDPSASAWKLAAERVRAIDVPVEFIGLPGDEIPLEPESVDTVLVTFSLCTIPDPVAALRAMGRVLKPGGKLLFSEHGLAPDPGVQRWQARLNRPWRAMAGGCHLNRDIPQLLQRGGFVVQELEQMYLPGTPRIAGYNYWGSAVGSLNA